MQWLDPYTRRTLAKRFCPSCGYDVADLVSRVGQCSECGQKISAADLVAKGEVAPPRPRWLVPLLLAPAAFGTVVFLIATRTQWTVPITWLWPAAVACAIWCYLVLVSCQRHAGPGVLVLSVVPAACLVLVNALVMTIAVAILWFVTNV